MIDFVKVGLKIANYRKQNNLTQDDIAEKLYITRQLVSKWENGMGIPSIESLVDLTKLFHTTLDDLLCLNEDVEVAEANIFNGRERLYVVKSIIDGSIKVNLSNVFYQFSPLERIMVLKAIKENNLEVNLCDLYPKLTPAEQRFLRKED